MPVPANLGAGIGTSRNIGYCGKESPALANTLTRRWPKSGRLIAEAYGFEPG
ncbi:helix-turn-helix domain-containing protein [Enterobacter roggenkampii]|nr:helix-turn-helix domain-containing protein [Enterobacter roggenkampii]MCK7069939.1 helix-turn-helix domain-containing protein [Enterobacter roggenkampii]MCK7092209.1 helix-turn-helix domain-containing protein [Enterobacter roggenkampii]